MPVQFLIGAGAGLVSAALFASAVVSAALAGLILYLCPLPLCLAGLAWGKQVVTLAGFVGTVLTILVLGASPGLVYAVTVAIPATALVHLILQHRTVPDPGDNGKQIVAWYPPGRLVAAAAVMAGVIAALVVLLLGPDMARYQAAIDEMLPLIHETLGVDNEVWTTEATENLRTLLTRALPAALAVVWITIALFNMWLAGTIAKGSAHALRPWPNFHALELPNAMVIGHWVRGGFLDRLPASRARGHPLLHARHAVPHGAARGPLSLGFDPRLGGDPRRHSGAWRTGVRATGTRFSPAG